MSSSAARARELTRANLVKTLDWTQHTPVHWSIETERGRMNFWPSTQKYQLAGGIVRKGKIEVVEQVVKQMAQRASSSSELGHV